MTFAPTIANIGAALDHAAACAPLESCGVILADGMFVAVPNLATEQGHFIMDRTAFCRLDTRSKCVAIVHSHVDYPAVAGENDRVMCEKSGLPWVIVSWPVGRHCVIEPCGYEAPLVGREWQWGSSDCYGIIRDGIQHYSGFTIPDFARDWLFWQRGENIITDQFHSAGFVSLPLGSQPRHCDVFGMALRTSIVDHLALFLEPDRILHQLYRQLSIRELYGGTWHEKTRLHLRHMRLM